jgi:hypothetical protein
MSASFKSENSSRGLGDGGVSDLVDDKDFDGALRTLNIKF